MSHLCSAPDASNQYDRKTLVQRHEVAARSHAHLQDQGNPVSSCMSVIDPCSPTKGVENLRWTRIGELKVGHTHRGLALWGTLCVNPFKIVDIMTVLLDDYGFAVTVAIHNEAPAASTLAALSAKYPKGAKVAIKEPYLQQALDGSLCIRVENPADMILIARGPPVATDLDLWLDLKELVGKGDECRRKGDVHGAILHYTNCICAPAAGDTRDARRIQHAADYNRWQCLDMREFVQALEDCNKSLEIHPGDLETLFDKCRALRGLEQYDQVFQVLQTALEHDPGQAEIEDALRHYKIEFARLRLGEYDISDFLCGRQPPWEVGDAIGNVEIKMTSVGRGRGLYATKKISLGEVFLVSNAIAIDNRAERTFKFVHSDKRDYSRSQEELVAAIVSAADKSQKLLRQLYVLDDGSEQVRTSIPTMGLFDVISRRNEKTEELLQLDVQRIRDIVYRNSFETEAEKLASKKGFSGLWLLPSFINHSCLPNATKVYVGNAMFLHAAKPIEEGEEITITYFDALLPLTQRQAMCDAWGFNCNCKRCILEKSLNDTLEILNQQFEALHGIALEEINAVRSSGQEFPRELPKSAEFAEMYEKLELIIAKQHKMQEEEKNWIRSSYVAAYWAGAQSKELFKSLDTIHDLFLQAVANTVPGDLRTLVVAGHQMVRLRPLIFFPWAVNRDVAQKHWDKMLRSAQEACVRALGKYSCDITRALVRHHADSIPSPPQALLLLFPWRNVLTSQCVVSDRLVDIRMAGRPQSKMHVQKVDNRCKSKNAVKSFIRFCRRMFLFDHPCSR